MQFEIDEQINGLSFCESVHYAISVFPHSLAEITRHSDTQRAIWFAGKHVNGWLSIKHYLTGFQLKPAFYTDSVTYPLSATKTLKPAHPLIEMSTLPAHGVQTNPTGDQRTVQALSIPREHI